MEIAVHGIAKKSMDLKKQDLELAEERRKIYVKQKQLQKKESP
jgi:hypothetical protein